MLQCLVSKMFAEEGTNKMQHHHCHRKSTDLYCIFSPYSSVIFHLGFEKSELFCKSWYGLIHPEDLSHASAQHYRLCEFLTVALLIHPSDIGTRWAKRIGLTGCLTPFFLLVPPVGDQSNTQAEMVIRLQAKDGVSWIWIYSLLRLESTEIPIVAHNYVIR